jgi:3-oxoacyl-[acyl-carrier protein] reductase
VFDLSGKVALVTGAGQGGGAGIAEALAAQGALVGVNDLVLERAEATVAGITKAGGRAEPIAFDITDVEAVAAGIARLDGPVDILVNNAGIPEGMRTAQFREMDRSEWNLYIDLNVYGSLQCVAAVIDGMCERGWGRIIQISSGAGRTGLSLGISLYGASKSGVEGFVRHLSQEVARDGVTANSIALGLMEPKAGPDVTAAMARRVPVGRLGLPADVGAAVVYVASEEAAWLTGQTINLNGGATML